MTQGAVCHLRTIFRQMGRSNVWNSHPDPRLCNPADSWELRWYISGYRRQYAAAGHEPVAARPVDAAKFRALMIEMDLQAGALQGLRLVLVLRDQALLCAMATFGRRGSDFGRLRWRDLFDQEGAEVDPALWAPQEGDAVDCKMFSKTYQDEREELPEAFVYTAQPGGREVNFLWRLHQYVRSRFDLGYSWGASGFVFSPQRKDKRGFEDRAVSGDACNKRLVGHLVKCGLHEGETAHGLRRGLAQGLLANGASEEAAMSHLGMRSPKTLRLYASRTRPVRGPDVGA